MSGAVTQAITKETLPITQKKQQNLVLRLIKEVLPYKIHVILLFGLSILSSVFSLIPPLLFQYAIDNYILKDNLNGLFIILLGLLVLGLFIAVQSFFQQKLSQYIGLNVVKNLRNNLFDHIAHLPFQFFDETTTGDVVARITNDTDQLTQFLNQSLINFLINIFMLIGILGVLLVWDYRFGLIYLGLIPLILYSMQVFTKKIMPMNKKIRLMNSSLTTSIQECFNGIREVKLYGREEFMHETFQKWNNEYFNSVIEANKVAASWNPFTPLILNLFSVIFITLGADLVMKSHFSIGELVAAITYLATMGGPIRAISGFSGMYSSAKAAAERIFEIMDRIPSIKDAPDAIALDHVQGNLEFRDVHFSYNAKSEILKDISLIVQPGERIALVGPSGVGKTTFVHMIPRFYDATQGSVLIDGIDVRKIQLNSLRRNVGIVMQNVYLYDGTIAQNIAYGKPEANLEEIQAAAQIAQLDEFIQTLPEQYNTPIGERGVKLSGGQAQRLSIARVLVTDPKLLILDEPTANVDAITDQNLMGAIQSIMKNRTTVIIAHRLWTIKNADKIVLLRDGKIEAIGNHQELMHNCPFYREFFDSQFSKEDLI